MSFIAPWEIFARFEPAYPDAAALAFVGPMAIVWFYMSWYDMSRLKIRNRLVFVVMALFVAVGPFVMPTDLYFEQIIQAAIVLVVVLVLYAAGTMGGGDAKYIAAASPYFLREDAGLILVIFTACVLGAVATHRLMWRIGVADSVADWASWSSGKRFPLGFALGGVTTFYLALAAF
ncbi:MAG: prepilin peptidase [Pseudomonadota bacterium]